MKIIWGENQAISSCIRGAWWALMIVNVTYITRAKDSKVSAHGNRIYASSDTWILRLVFWIFQTFPMRLRNSIELEWFMHENLAIKLTRSWREGGEDVIFFHNRFKVQNSPHVRYVMQSSSLTCKFYSGNGCRKVAKFSENWEKYAEFCCSATISIHVPSTGPYGTWSGATVERGTCCFCAYSAFIC